MSVGKHYFWRFVTAGRLVWRGCQLLGFIILINITPVSAKPLHIEVVGLFSEHAVINVDGQQHMLKSGQTSPEGIKLISADSNQAVLQIDGKKTTYHLGQQISADYGPAPEQATVTLWPIHGMYITSGNINGYSVDFVVDTGASVVALNAATAKRLDINYQHGQQVGIRTAMGLGKAYRVTLDKVQVGDITLDNVTAVVIDGPEPSTVLLGMTFLSSLDIQHDGDKLQLKQKF